LRSMIGIFESLCGCGNQLTKLMSRSSPGEVGPKSLNYQYICDLPDTSIQQAHHSIRWTLESIDHNRYMRELITVFVACSNCSLLRQHLHFAILAITVLLIFTALPLLILLLYPTTFHKVLGYIKIRWHALHTFADVFQGCYKNRTDGTCDYRYFSAFYFILRVVIFLVRNLKTPGLSWTISAVCFAIGSLLFALLRPYKKNWLNVLDCLALALLALIHLWILYSLEVQAKWFQSAGLLTAVPLLYLVMYATYKLLSFLGVLEKCQQLSRYLQQSLQQRWQHCKCRQQEHYM